MSSYTRKDILYAKMTQQAYKLKESREKGFVFEGETYSLNEQESSNLYAVYENSKEVIVNLHGVDFKRFNKNVINAVSNNFFNDDKNNKLIQRFCDYHKRLKNEKRKVVVNGHSLGTWIIASCEVQNRGSFITGNMYAPYLRTKDKTGDFMAGTSRYKKIFYENDLVSSFLLMSRIKNNVIQLHPFNNPLKFLNPHGIDNFTKDINMDIKQKIKDDSKHELDTEEKIEEPLKKTNLSIISYNVKLFPSIIQNQKNSFRAKHIADRLVRLSPDVIGLQELFGGEEKNIIKNRLQKAGYHNTKAFGKDILSGKLIGSGVMIFSKYPFVSQDKTIFRRGTKEDDLAGKGSVRATIRKNGININLINSHYQSGRKEKAFKIKESQLAQTNELVKKDFPTFLFGDFNINTGKFSDFFDEQTGKHGWIQLGPNEPTTNNNFQGVSANILDHFLTIDNDDFDIQGSVRVLKTELQTNEPYRIDEKPKPEIQQDVEEVGRKIKGLFQRKKKRKKVRKRNTMLTKNLSDHFPIMLSVSITEKPKRLGRDGRGRGPEFNNN